LCQEAIKKEVAKQIKEAKSKEREENRNRNVVDFLIKIEWVIQRSGDKCAKVESMETWSTSILCSKGKRIITL